jgi:uncharacterized protein (DUF2267 family)
MELIDAVQRNTGADAQHAEAAIESVLKRLGHKVTGSVADQLAEQLPDPAARALQLREDDQASAGDSGELARGVADDIGVDETEGLNLLQGVFRALDEAVDPTTIKSLRDQLPYDLANLFPPR